MGDRATHGRLSGAALITLDQDLLKAIGVHREQGDRWAVYCVGRLQSAATSELEMKMSPCGVAGVSQLTEPIWIDTKLSEAPGTGQTIFEYAPTSRGANDYKMLIELVEGMPSVTHTNCDSRRREPVAMLRK